MFCPGCSTENNPDLKYCRQCGMQLSSVRIAMESRIDEALEKYEKGAEKIKAGIITFTVLFFVGIINLIFKNTWGFTINMILAFAVTLPILIVGFNSLRGGSRLLKSETRADDRALKQSGGPVVELPPAQTTDRSLAEPLSVTEHTTRELKEVE